MTDRNRKFERNGGSGATNDDLDGGAARDGRGADSTSLSRRHFLRTSTVAGAGTFGLGGAGAAAGQTEVRRTCNDGSIRVGNGDGRVLVNQWSTTKPEQCVFKNDDGSFGWEWERRDTDVCPENCPNYAQMVIGDKPWSSPTSAPILPEQIGTIDELDVDLDVDNGAEFIDERGDEWNLALEWWHTESRPPIGGDPKHEIMLLLEWSESHDDAESIEDEAFEDAYGNAIDHWQMIRDRVDWETFHIFRVSANEVPENLDLTAIFDYLREFEDDPSTYEDDLWMTGIELGNETWDYTRGKTTVHNLDVRLNGQVATTGVDSTFDEAPVDDTPPTAPTNLTIRTLADDGVEVAWDPATDEGGSGLAEYAVAVDGEQTTVSAGTTSAELPGVDAYSTGYTVEIRAVDGAGNESEAATTTVAAGPDEIGPDAAGPPTDPDGDDLYEDVNGDGATNLADAGDLFQHRDSDAVQNNVQNFDFSGNGEIDLADVVQLFQENTG